MAEPGDLDLDIPPVDVSAWVGRYESREELAAVLKSRLAEAGDREAVAITRALAEMYGCNASSQDTDWRRKTSAELYSLIEQELLPGLRRHVSVATLED